MTDISPTTPETTETLSTTLDTNPVDVTRNGGGEVREPEKTDKPESVQDSIRSVIKEADAKEAEAKEKDEKSESGEKQPDAKEAKEAKAGKLEEKPAKAAKAPKAEAQADEGEAEQPAEGREATGGRQSEGRQHSEPPSRFLPEARDKWGPTPFAVKAEVHRIAREHEAEVAKYKETSERYESIRAFDEAARRSGRELKDSLTRIAQVEKSLGSNPILGMEMILREIGPTKADGTKLSLYELAHVIAKQTPQQYQQTIQQAGMNAPRQAAPQQHNPHIAMLEQRLSSIEVSAATAKVMPVIEEFAANHPDYYKMEDAIAQVLKSGVIEKLYGSGLSSREKLAEAYRMVGGRSAPSHSDPAASQGNSQPKTQAKVDPDGLKSVSGAPNGGEDPSDDDADTDIRSLLKKGLRRAV